MSVLAWSGRKVTTWRVPGGSPDMGGVSADGRTLWLTGRYNAEVYAINTRTGRCALAFPSAPDRTGSRSSRSRAATRWGTPAPSGKRTVCGHRRGANIATRVDAPEQDLMGGGVAAGCVRRADRARGPV